MNGFSDSDHQFMALAMEEAERAASLGEVPVGAVVVLDGEIIALECNRQITLNDPSAHAEVLALRKAGQMLDNYRLPDCELFVTQELRALLSHQALPPHHAMVERRIIQRIARTGHGSSLGLSRRKH